MLSGAFIAPLAAHAGAIAPEKPLPQAETPVSQFTDDDDPRWKTIEDSSRYDQPATGAPNRAPWYDDQDTGHTADNLLSTRRLFGPEIARQLDQTGRQSAEDILSLESLAPSVQPGAQQANGTANQNEGRSRLFDLAEDILQPVKEGDGVISFSITGIGTFVVSREQESGDLHIREISSDLSATVKRPALHSRDGTDTDTETTVVTGIDTTLTFRQLMGKIFGLLFGGPQLLILGLTFGLWLTLKVWLKMRTRTRAG